jgi:glycosyltransferase involved in cell wall biosynthesis
MRILQVINSMQTAGAEKLLRDLIPKFNKQEDICCDILVFSSNNEIFIKELKELKNINVIELNYKNIYNPFIIFSLLKFFKQYEIIHSHLFPAQYFVAFAKLFSFSKTRLIFTEHCTTNTRVKSCLFSFINKPIYSFYNKTICISEEIKNIYIKYTGLNQSRFPVISNGVDLDKIYNSKTIDLNTYFETSNIDNKFIVQVSAFRDQKDQNTLIKALLFLPQNFKIILIGEGSEIEKSIKLVKDLGIDDKVAFLGLRNDVTNFLVSSDYNVLSTKYEGMSLSCIEGMASGKPFLASNVPGVTNLVGNHGVLFPSGNSEALAKKIIELEKDSIYTKNVIESCKLRASEFSIDIMSSNYLNLYKEII